jgi:hypothetical protein
MEHRVQGHIANAIDYDLSFKGTLPVGANIALVDSTANSLVPCVASEAEQAGGSNTANSNDRSGPIQTVAFVDGAAAGATSIPLNSNLLDTTLNYAICYSDGTTQSSGSTWYDSGIRVQVSKVLSLHYNREQQTEVATEVYMRTWLSTNKANGASNDYPVVTNRLPLVGSGNPTYDLQYRGYLPDDATFSMVHASAFIREPCASSYVAGHASDDEHFLASPAVIKDFTVDTSQYLDGMAFNTGSGNFGSSGALVAVCYLDESAGLDMWKDSHIRLTTSKIHVLTSYGLTHKTTGMISSKASLRVQTRGTMTANGDILALVEENINNERPCDASVASTTSITGVDVLLYSGLSSDHSRSNYAHTLDTTGLATDKTFALCYAEGDGSSSDTSWEDSGLRLRTPKVTTVTYSQPARAITSASCFDGDLWGAADCNPSKTCHGAGCSGGDPSVLCAADATESCTVLPRHDGADGTGVDLTISGPDASVATYASLVRQDLGIQSNNPCRDARQASAAANSAGTANARQHSGALPVTNGAFTLPQVNDVNNVTNLLQYDGTFAVCYAEGDGSDSDATWRDTYVRITLSKIENVQASDMVVTTRGMLANVPSLRVTWTGSLGWKKWINLVEVTANSGVPCNKAFAESYEQCAEGCEFDASGGAFISSSSAASAEECKTICTDDGTCKAYTWVGGSTTCNLFGPTAYTAGGMVHDQPNSYSGVKNAAFPQTGWLQAGAASEMVDFDTSSLTADALYTVCYGDEAGTPATGAPSGSAEWTDSGLRLRFVKWDNPQKSRVASGAATLMRFSINHQDSHGNFFDTANDYFAVLRGASDCTGAPAAPLLSDGTNAKRLATHHGDGTYGFAMPSGTGAAERATAWRQCHPMLYGPTRIDYDNYETCDEPGAYQDENLQEGTYVVCFCDSNNGNSGCDHANEWIKLSSSATDPDMLKIVQTPRLGRAYDSFSSSSHVGSVRGISGGSHTYNIKSSDTSGLQVDNLDQIFFKSTFCDTIPTMNTPTETAPINVTGYDADSNSGTYKAARVITPTDTPLTSLGADPRPLVSCYATQESLQGTAEARDYVELQDGLEIINPPRLGTNVYGEDNGVIRSLSGNSPIFEGVSLRDGDRLFFKEMTTFSWQLTGTLGIGSDVCDYTTHERCSCDGSGVLSCSNAAHKCTGMSCTNTIPEGADTDCTTGNADVYGAITSVIPSSNAADATGLINGLSFQDEAASGTITTFTVALNADGFTQPIDVPQTADDVPYLSDQTDDLKFAVDGVTRPLLSASVGNTYVFDLNSQTLNANPFVLSLKEGGEHNEGDIYSTGVTYFLDGIERPLADYLTYFASAQTRSITFTPTEADIVFYHSYTTQNLGAQMTVYRDDVGKFQLPIDVPLTSASATVPRFLSACFIPAGAIESLHVGSDCTYHEPKETAHGGTCTKDLINSHRLQDYLQVLPEPTDALKTSHNQSKIYDLNFNEPQFGTFWRTTNHWCEGADEFTHPCGVRSTDRGFGGNSTDLCCVAPPNFASGSPGDVIVLKKEDTLGSGDCTGVELITDEDYLVGSQYTRKMTLTTLDADRTSQSEGSRPDLLNGVPETDYRSAATKGAGVSHHAIADGKVNELEQGYYTICYATAESGADDNADFVKLSKSIEILPRSATGPSMTVPATVLLGHNINVQWASTSGYQQVPSEPHSWVGLFRAGECANDSGDDQNQCFLASQTLDLANQPGEGTITFSASDYKLTAGTYEIRYFEGTSRDGHGQICRGLENVGRDSYIHCLLESVYTSEEITVFADVNSLDDLSAIPGLEMAFEGEVSRFSGKGAGLPGSDHDGFGFKRK